MERLEDYDTIKITDLMVNQPNYLVSHHLETYEQFIGVFMKKIMEYRLKNFEFETNHKELNLKFKSKMKLVEGPIFADDFPKSPSLTEEGKITTRKDALFPTFCRKYDFSYVIDILCKLRIETNVYEGEKLMKTYETENTIKIISLPIMIMSSKCSLSALSESELLEIGEDPTEVGGYFILSGGEKIIVNQESLRVNHVIYKRGKGTDFEHRTEIKSRESNELDARFETGVEYKDGKLYVKVKLPGSGKEKNRKHIPIELGIMFRLFGFENDVDILNCILGKDILDKENLTYLDETMISYILPSLDTSVITPEGKKFIVSKYDALEFLTIKYAKSMDKTALDGNLEKLMISFKVTINKRFLPHLNDEKLYGENIDLIKGIYLGYMLTRKTLLGILDIIKPFDNCSFVNKRIEATGILMAQLFKKCYDQTISEIAADINKKFHTVKKEDIEKIYKNIIAEENKSERFDKSLKQAIMTGKWQINKMYGSVRTGVTQAIEPVSALNILAQKRKVETTVMGKHASSGNTDMKNLHLSSYGFLDPSDTPEGEKIGNVKSLSLSTKISLWRDDDVIFDIIYDDEEMKEKIMFINTIFSGVLLEGKTLLFINGKLIGITKYANDVYRKLIELRRSNDIPFDVSIVFDRIENELRINCDIGRLIRPVIIVDKGNKPRYTKEIRDKIDELTWGDFLRMGIIEYIDPEEQQFNTRIALYLSDVYNADWEIDKFTHCEIHPFIHLGASTSIVPFLGHDPATRILFQANMGKQGIGRPTFNSEHRYDTSANISARMERPLVSTIGARYVGYDLSPQGQNLMVLIGTYTGFNQEDSLILCKNSIERGLLYTVLYKTVKDIIDNEDQMYMSFNKGKNYIEEKVDATKFMKLNPETGIVPIGAHVEYGDVLAFKVQSYEDKMNEKKKRYKNISIIYKERFPGIIDSILKYQSGIGHQSIKIRIRTPRKLQVGDKFACFDDKTEIFTSEGWKNFKDLQIEEDYVATLNDKEEMEFSGFENFTEEEYDGKLVQIETSKFSCRVTPNHEMLVKLPGEKKYRFVKASELRKHKSFMMRKSSKGIISSEFAVGEKLTIEGNEYNTEALLKLIGVIYRFGEITPIETRKLVYNKLDKKIPMHNIIRFVPRMEKTINMGYVEYLCNKLGIVLYSDNFIYDPGLISMKLKNPNKFPSFVWKLDREHQSFIADGILHAIVDKSVILMVKDMTLSDDFQRLFINIGWSCDNIKKANTGSITGFGGYYFMLNIFKTTEEFSVRKQDIKLIDYKGIVRCVEVKPYHTILTRRKGVVMWSGQSRHGQKGTCSIILRGEEMPFTEEGITPDIIVNPHAFPTRMTLGMILEIVSGIIGTNFYTCIDSTAFMKTDIEMITEKMRDLGYDDYGNTTFYSGYTGKEIKTKMFFGPCFYQRLKHMVDNKIHSRNYGQKKMKTRQPPEGRGKNGGLRLGIMEKDAIVAHGVSKYIWEKYMLCSDGIPVYFCDKCGLHAIANETKGLYKCNYCKSSKIKKYHMPYCMANLVMRELEGMGIFMRVFSETSEEAEIIED